MKSINYLVMSSITAALLSSVACASIASEQVAYGQPGDPKKVNRTVRIEASEIKFNVAQLTFKTGETVKFVLVNKGEQDHELTIGDTAMQLEHRKMMQDMAAMPNMVMSKMPGHEHAAKSMISVKPSQTKELVWQFTKPGSFEFACNFPGHAEVGMAGAITVR